MTDHEHLERAYRRLLAWYPRKFRHENGQEILAVLMAGAPPGQRRPGLAEAADLIRSGLWLRLWPSVPRSARTVRAAVKLMYAGAAVSTVNLVILLALTVDIKGSASWLNTPFIPVSIAWSLAPLALWLWMARETGRGRNWARIVSTVLFGAATLDLTEVFGPPGIRLSLVPVIAGSSTSSPCCTGWSASPWCGCCGARPPERSSGRRVTRRPSTRRRWPSSTIRRRWPNSRGSGHGCRVRREPC